MEIQLQDFQHHRSMPSLWRMWYHHRRRNPESSPGIRHQRTQRATLNGAFPGAERLLQQKRQPRTKIHLTACLKRQPWTEIDLTGYLQYNGVCKPSVYVVENRFPRLTICSSYNNTLCSYTRRVLVQENGHCNSNNGSAPCEHRIVKVSAEPLSA